MFRISSKLSRPGGKMIGRVMLVSITKVRVGEEKDTGAMCNNDYIRVTEIYININYQEELNFLDVFMTPRLYKRYTLILY